MQIRIYWRKTEAKNLLLNYCGGVGNKPELAEEVCVLTIDSIQTKLSFTKNW